VSRATIGIVRPGSTYADMIERFGDYDAWFDRALEPLGAEVRAWDVIEGDPPDLGDAAGWIVTGARSAVYDDDPWIERLLEWIRHAVDAGAPLLGVCYGHQALCAATGGIVEKHPRGWELGTVEVELTPSGREDPLFEGLPDTFLVQATHQDYVAMAPPGGRTLAGNLHTAAQAVAVGPSARGVQFHPEVTAAIEDDFVARRKHLVPGLPLVREAPWGAKILENFVNAFVCGKSVPAP